MITNTVQIGNTQIGGNNPVRIQSMTNTQTADVIATVEQICELFLAGAELVRITVNDTKAAEAVPMIRAELVKLKMEVPLIGDFHFNGHILLDRYPEMAQTLDKWRINPGNVGVGKKRDGNFERIIKMAIEYNKPVRIGVNAGSLDQELLADLMNKNAEAKGSQADNKVLVDAMVKSALQSAELAEKIGLSENKIIISVKMSDLNSMIEAYEMLELELGNRAKCYPIHLGLTEAGGGMQGIVASSLALGLLLHNGIGDTIRVSLTTSSTGKRTDEVEVCRQVLQSLGLRSFSPKVTSCPGCGRTDNKIYQELTEEVKQYIEEQMPVWHELYPGVENLKVAVMGCVVNGPGESKTADIGISMPGNSEEPRALVFEKGVLIKELKNKNISAEFKKMLLKYIQKTYQ